MRLEALHQLRNQIGLSSAELAELAGIDTARLVELESGASPYLDEQLALGRALSVEPAALTRKPTSRESRLAVRFRTASAGRPLSTSDHRLLGRGAEIGRVLQSLNDLLGRTASRIGLLRKVVGLDGAKPPWQQGYILGAEARMAIASEPEPIMSVQRLVEELGVHVARVPFDDEKIDAASLYEAGAAPVILLNASSKRIRQRLPRRAALAHELCHLLHDGGHREMAMVSRLDEQRDGCEQRANGFAPSFLAPKAWAKEAMAAEPEAIAMELGEKWGLSFEGAVWHAKNLKLIHPTIAEKLKQRTRTVRPDDFESEIGRVEIDLEPTPLVRGLLSDTAVAAAELGVISRGRLKEIFAL